MKKLKLFLGLLGAAMLLPACSEDEIQGYDPGQAESDMTQYMAIQIVSPNEGSRADSDPFAQGVWSENDVETLDFIFYDSKGTPTATMKSFKKNEGTWHPASGIGNYESGNVNRIWTNVIPVDLVQGQNLPAQVVCLVNASLDIANQIASKSLDALISQETSNFSREFEETSTDADGKTTTSKKPLFVMSNSVYYGKDVVTGLENQRLCATPINQLYGTREDAQKAIDSVITGEGKDASSSDTEAKLVTVYVERLAAKIGLNLASDVIQKYTLANGEDKGQVTLTFVPEYWFMNATSNQAFVTKRYGLKNGDEINYAPTFAEINNSLKGSGMEEVWNDPTNHRSYWGCSPSYYQTSYPKVSDNVNDLEDGTKEQTYDNTYYSYNQVIEQAEKKDVSKQALAYDKDKGFAVSTTGSGATAVCSGYIYTRETTAAIREIKSGANPAATVASAVIVGHYYAGAIAPPEGGAIPTFYIDRHDGEQGTYYANVDNVMKALAGRQNTIFKKTVTGEGESQTTSYNALTADEIMSETYKSKFTVEHPLAAVRNLLTNKDVAGRLVTLQLKTTAATSNSGLYYYDAAKDNYVEINDATKLAIANAGLCTTGYMDMYSGGLAFFSVPIRHLGFGNGTNGDSLLSGTMTGGENPSLDTTKPVTYNWGNMRIGDLGVVRNHVYTLTVTGISGLGSGLRSPDQPIVPPVDITQSYVAMRLNILSWRVVPAWSVAL